MIRIAFVKDLIFERSVLFFSSCPIRASLVPLSLLLAVASVFTVPLKNEIAPMIPDSSTIIANIKIIKIIFKSNLFLNLYLGLMVFPE